tara:strand:- start:924 stop:1412 length:489 start_codon:yes stop_codon:yes gene_type:complete
MFDDELPEEPLEGMDDLINQLRQNNNEVKKAQKAEEFELKPEQLEQFILNSTGKLVQDSMDMVSTVKQYVECAPDSEGVSSLAELLKATTSSIDTLSKLLIQDKRGDTATKLKKIDIAAKAQLMDQEHNNKLALTRKEVLDQLIQNAEVVEITDPDDQPSTD